MGRGTIKTTFISNNRVCFSCPDDGYNIDDLDALIVAAKFARIQMTAEQEARYSLLSDHLEIDFRIQQERPLHLEPIAKVAGRPVMFRRPCLFCPL